MTLPRSQAVKVANDLAKWGVKGMWNFSHVDLQVPEDVVVENVHLTDSLMTLLYKINEMYAEESDLHQLHHGLPIKPKKFEDIKKIKIQLTRTIFPLSSCNFKLLIPNPNKISSSMTAKGNVLAQHLKEFNRGI